MIKILSFSTNPDILPVMDRLVNKQAGWTGRPVADIRTARSAVLKEDFDIVLLGAGTGVAERESLQVILKELGKPTLLIDHYGGGSGLLFAEVMEAMAGR